MTDHEEPLESEKAIPPGEYLRAELTSRHMSQTELARRMGRPAQTINEIINARKALTEETALELERVLDTPASVWVNLEARYQLAIARMAEADTLEGQSEWLGRFPVREMERRKWIPTAENKAEKVRALMQFFGVASFSNWREHEEALGFRVSANAKMDTGPLAVWVRKGELEGGAAATARYDETAFREALAFVRTLTTQAPQSAWTQLQESCAPSGVAAVVVREFPKIGANGVARWLTPEKALIQLNLRYRWADIFWFTFFHEAAHILMHEPRRVFVELEGNPRRDPQEDEADALAEELLIPTDGWEQFVLQGEFDAATVRRFSRDVQIHPGIVVGRLQHVGLLSWGSSLNALRERLAWS